MSNTRSIANFKVGGIIQNCWGNSHCVNCGYRATIHYKMKSGQNGQHRLELAIFKNDSMASIYTYIYIYIYTC